jgi:hypothetical protein
MDQESNSNRGCVMSKELNKHFDIDINTLNIDSLGLVMEGH